MEDLTRAINAQELKQLRTEFETKNLCHIPHFLTPYSLGFLHKTLSSPNITEELKTGPNNIFQERHIESPKTIQILKMIFENSKIFKDISAISQLTVNRISGARIYKLTANTGDNIGWHQDDWVENRLLGFSLNLSQDIYVGGDFEIRELNSNLIHKITSGPGDLHFFKINNTLEHRVLPVTGEKSRTAYAGWFKN